MGGMGNYFADSYKPSEFMQEDIDSDTIQWICSAEECLDESLAIAKRLREEFGSWDELCRSYLYGYYFWKKDNIDSAASDTGGGYVIQCPPVFGSVRAKRSGEC